MALSTILIILAIVAAGVGGYFLGVTRGMRGGSRLEALVRGTAAVDDPDR
jgi:hypothetical protein